MLHPSEVRDSGWLMRRMEKSAFTPRSHSGLSALAEAPTERGNEVPEVAHAGAEEPHAHREQQRDREGHRRDDEDVRHGEGGAQHLSEVGPGVVDVRRGSRSTRRGAPPGGTRGTARCTKKTTGPMSPIATSGATRTNAAGSRRRSRSASALSDTTSATTPNVCGESSRHDCTRPGRPFTIRTRPR